MMAPASRTADLFLIQPPHEKQAFLRLILKSAAWRHGELQTQFEKPSENLRRSNQLSRRKDNEIGGDATRNQIWLPKRNLLTNFSQKARPLRPNSTSATGGRPTITNAVAGEVNVVVSGVTHGTLPPMRGARTLYHRRRRM